MVNRKMVTVFLEWACGYLDVFIVPMEIKVRELKTRLSEYKQTIRLRAFTGYVQ